MKSFKFGGFFPPFPEVGGNHITEAEEVLGRPIDILLTFISWQDKIGPEWFKRADGREIVLTWEPWDPEKGMKDTEFGLQSISDGTHDDYIKTSAKTMKRIGQTVYLRPLHEMNGNWYPWAPAGTGESPDKYVTAWRHIHDIFTEVGATNVQWLWSVNVDDVPERNRFEKYYPGADYVDIYALDGYNWGTSQDWSSWRSFSSLLKPAYSRVTKLGTQPVWITEIGCAHEGGDKVKWVRDMLKRATKLKRLEALLWFNIDKETDWRITEDPAVAAEFKL